MSMGKRILGWSSLWLFLLVLGAPRTEGSTGTGSQTLTATINPIGSVSVPGSTTLTTSVKTFQPFTGSLAVSYRARTTPTGGGTITLKVSSDFTPTGGPSAATGALSYTCSGATLGTACSGTQTASPSSQTPVLALPASGCTGGGGACSSQDPNSVNLIFSLTDDPGYVTASYSANVTFTISAT